MSRKTSLFGAVILASIALSSNSACGNFSASTAAENTGKLKTYLNENAKPITAPTKFETPKIKKADYTMTAEELVEEFMRDGATSADLKKYAGKNIAVTGRVAMFSFEPNGTAPPYVVLAAPGLERGVTCYHNGGDTEGRKMIRKDKIVTMQGFQDESPMAGTSPALIRCVVLKAD